jgi:hypothetical protein
MQTARTEAGPPAWLKAIALRSAALGRRVVKKPDGREYEYLYLRFDARAWPELADAHRIRAIIAPPDLSAPPATITARLLQRGKRVVGFDVPAVYQNILKSYARNGVVAVLGVEVLERSVSERNRAAPAPET